MTNHCGRRPEEDRTDRVYHKFYWILAALNYARPKTGRSLMNISQGISVPKIDDHVPNCVNVGGCVVTGERLCLARA